MDDKHKRQLIQDLETIHLPFGRKIFPLSPQSKIPIKGLKWRSTNFSFAELCDFVNRGHNLAWALGTLDVVIDIDPRKTNSLGSMGRIEQLASLAPGGFANLTSTVETGGADRGHHYYMRLPEKVKINSSHVDIPDLEFRRYGQYVVLPGSQHPETQRYYEWDIFSPYHNLPMFIPSAILDLLVITAPEKDIIKNDNKLNNASTDELKHYLYQLDPKKFRTRQDWIELAFMIHAGCGEQGRDIFLEWSATDEQYADCTEENNRIWNSIRNDKPKNLSFGSLVKLVIDNGGRHYLDSSINDFNDNYNFDKIKYNEFIEKISKMSPSISEQSLLDIIGEANQFGVIAWENSLRNEIAQCLGIKTSIVDKLYKKNEKQKKEKKTQKIDYPEIIAKSILKRNFQNGKTLIHAINQRFYHYAGTHWVPILDNEITKLIYEESKKLKIKNKATHEASSKVKPAITALIAKTAKLNNDVFNFIGELRSVINCKNGELHLDPRTGEFEFRKHSPASYLLQCLDTPYDPNAKCPIWDETLFGIFRDHKDPDGMIRHIHEIFGYMIQPQKNIASWFLWLGSGNNGKSITLEILQSLMGPDSYLPRSIHDFDSANRSNHAIASLVGKLAIVDDDADTEKVLPSSVLKKFAEGRVLEANPKHRDQFNFRSSATPIVLYNGWPRIRDITYGMLRKVFVLPFKRRFIEGIDEDKTIRERVEKNELPGILNRALIGLRILRARGHFLQPVDCIESKNEWLHRSNDILSWIHECCSTGNGAWSSVTQLFTSYQIWADQNHRRFRHSLVEIENHLIQNGYEIKTIEDVRGFAGLKIN